MDHIKLTLIASMSLKSSHTVTSCLSNIRLILSSCLLLGPHSDLFPSFRVSGLKSFCNIFLKSCNQHFDRLVNSSLPSQLESLPSNVQDRLAVRLPGRCRYYTLVCTDYADSDTYCGTWRLIVW